MILLIRVCKGQLAKFGDPAINSSKNIAKKRISISNHETKDTFVFRPQNALYFFNIF